MTAPGRLGYTDVRELRGPLVVVGGVDGVGWDESVLIRMASGERRHGLVLEVDRDLAVVQVLEGMAGMAAAGTEVEFAGQPLRVPVGPGWLGRVCNGRGEPIDGGPPVLGHRSAPVSGHPLNPTWREPPADPVLTGVSVIDALTTLVRGQKLPVFSLPGLPHLELAAQIAAQATVAGEPFSVVFAGMGLTHADAAFVRDALEERSAAGELVLLLNTADDPVIERILTPRVALTVAEHLAFGAGGGRHVLVVMTDMTSYAEALREVSAARGEVPARRAYPGYLYSDLASLYERCGRDARHARLGDRAARAHDAGRGHHPPGARPHRLHHRGPGGALRGRARARRLPAGRPAVLAVAADAQGRGTRPHPRRPPAAGRPAARRAREGAAGARARPT